MQLLYLGSVQVISKAGLVHFLFRMDCGILREIGCEMEKLWGESC